MRKRYDQKSWQLECGKASKNGTLNELMKSLTRGDVEVTDDSGQPISFAPPPDRLEQVPHATSAKPDAAPVTKSFSLGDRAAFEDCIANETPTKKVEMRMWFDAKRKEEGLD